MNVIQERTRWWTDPFPAYLIMYATKASFTLARELSTGVTAKTAPLPSIHIYDDDDASDHKR